MDHKLEFKSAKAGFLFYIKLKKGGDNLKELTPKQKKFCQEYLKDFNAARAYKTVYKVKNDSTARANGSRLLTNANISQYLSETMHQTKVNDILDINGVLDNLSQLAIGKPREKVFKRISYKGKKPKVEYDNVTTVTPEDQDQLKALELLGKYYKIFTDKVETQTDITVNIDPGDYDG